MNDLKSFLEFLYTRYNSPHFISSDPIKWVHNFNDPVQIEISAFISSVFAYGRVDQIDLALKKVFQLLGKDPLTFLFATSNDEIRRSVDKIYYRFYTSSDIYTLLVFLKSYFSEHLSLSYLFEIKNGYVSFQPMFEKWQHFIVTNELESTGTRYMVPDPGKKSASKRMMMFLRWMVRKDEIDFGIWQNIKTEQLLLPMDTHVSRICYYLGLSENSQSTFRNSVSVTENLKRLNGNDPVKYDFAISRLGILNECPAKRDILKCHDCHLVTVCSR